MTPNNQTGAINLIIGIVVAIALVLGGGYYVYEKTGGDLSMDLPPILSDEADETSFTTTPPPAQPSAPSQPSEQVTPPANNPSSGWQVYTNNQLGFQVSYPADKLVLDSANAKLYRKLEREHMYSLKDGSDLGLATNMSIQFSNELINCNRLRSLGSLSEPFAINQISGQKYEAGAEGEGHFVYCIENTSGQVIFEIEQRYLSAAYGLDIANDPKFISLAEQKTITENVLKTFKFTN